MWNDGAKTLASALRPSHTASNMQSFKHYVTTTIRRNVTTSVLTIASSKGGPSKTTLSQVLAGSLASFCRLVVLDADPTKALSRWASSAYEGARFEAIAEPNETRLAHLISAKANTADLVIEDTAGFGLCRHSSHDVG
jgi:hypothetical protein